MNIQAMEFREAGLRIPYYREYSLMLNSVRAAIFLQYVKELWITNGMRPFYKFNSPCRHELYQAGMSWEEELWFTRAEVSAARNVVATKINSAPLAKKEALATNKAAFSDSGRMINASGMVYYWTDAQRVTWYGLNLPLMKDAAEKVGVEDFGDAMERPLQIPRERERFARPGYIYLAHSESGYFKIGLSKHPQKRIEQLNNGPLEVVLVHAFPADDATVAEETLHSLFSDKKVKGEWFNLSQKDVDWLCCIEGYNDGTFHANS